MASRTSAFSRPFLDVSAPPGRGVLLEMTSVALRSLSGRARHLAAIATRLSTTGWHGCRFPLVRPHMTRNGVGKPVTEL
jgi:hypothetical protein